MKEINDIVELGNGDSYKITSVEEKKDFVSYEAQKLTVTGKTHNTLKATLMSKSGEPIKLVRTYK